MWGREKNTTRPGRIDTLIGQNTEIHGDLIFRGGLHVDGVIRGNVIAADEEGSSLLSLSEKGAIEGEVRVPNLVLNGTVNGDVYVTNHIELAVQGRVNGNVQYRSIQMARGAAINGKLVHRGEKLLEDARPQGLLPSDEPAFGDS